MHMPYMRVAIYALTFMTYAYTGYGSNVISSLRDAIIAAEAVFGDVFKNAIHVAKKFQTVHEVFDAAVEETCIYKCPNGRNAIYTYSFWLYIVELEWNCKRPDKTSVFWDE